MHEFAIIVQAFSSQFIITPSLLKNDSSPTESGAVLYTRILKNRVEKALKSLYRQTPLHNLFILILSIASVIGCSKDDGEGLFKKSKNFNDSQILLINEQIVKGPLLRMS